MHPRVFGKYRILKLLPLGGMGRVYLAEDTENGRQVALKLIEHGGGPDSEEIVAAERRGAILQSRLCGLDHRVTIINSYGDLDGFFYIEMEYVEGRDLSEVLSEGPLGIPFAARIGSDLCQVLHRAHTFNAEIEGHQYQGIVHGDIKPRNIRITPDGALKVLDFGIAKALSMTREFTHNQFASTQYSSPERLNTGEVDVPSDLWSVGVVLFETVTARPYFDEQPVSKLEHAVRNYRDLRRLPPSIPEAFRAIVYKSLHPDPELRYPSASAFAADLDAFLAGKPVGALALEDGEATRRTSRKESVDADDAPTRRTERPVPIGKAPMPASKPAIVRRPLSARQRRVRLGVAVAVFGFVGWLFLNEYQVWAAGRDLAHKLETEQVTDVNDAWTRYEQLAARSVLPVVLSSTRGAIQQRLTAAADRVIGEYRTNDSPSVSENDWRRARAALARALEISPRDKFVRGKIQICDGHINRILGSARGNGKLLQDARSNFEQAHDLMPQSPDPYLGLARLYVYALHDVERAEDALKAADKRGHELGRRERTQLADGYRDRAERLMREAYRARNLPEEEDYLKRAEKDFRKAEDLYSEVVPFSNSTASLRKVYQHLDTVGMRIQEIKESR